MSPEIFSFLQKLLVNRPFLVWTDNCPMCKCKGTPSPPAGTNGPSTRMSGLHAAGEGWPRGELQPHISSGSTSDVMSDQSSLKTAPAFSIKHWMKTEQSWPWISACITWSRLQHSAVVWNAAFAAMAWVLARVSSFSAESAVWMIKKFWKKYSGISVCLFGRSF